jgi:quercetin dioxygenase-like cupin family protein
MKTKISLWIVLMLSLTLAVGPSTSVAQTKVLNAQEATPKRTDVLTNDLAGIAGKRVAVYRVEIPPGGVAGKHRHPVDTFVYVLSGTLTLEQEGQGSRTLKVGEVFQEVPGGIYNAKNTGTSPLTLLVVSLGDKDQPFSVPVK